MAAPTPVIVTHTNGNMGVTTFQAIWTAGAADNLSDVSLLDISTVSASASLTIREVSIFASPGVAIDLEYDDDSADELILSCPLGAQVATANFNDVYGYNAARSGIKPNATGGTNDLLVTSRSAADGDEAIIIVKWYAGTQQ